MNRMRLKIAARLKEAQNTTAMLTTFNEIDMRSAAMHNRVIQKNNLFFFFFLVLVLNILQFHHGIP